MGGYLCCHHYDCHTSLFSAISWENYSLSINRKTRISDATFNCTTQTCPWEQQIWCNPVPAIHSCPCHFSFAPKFPRGPQCLASWNGFTVFPTGQPHQPLAVSNWVPAALEDNDSYLFIYWRCSPKDPPPNEFHICHTVYISSQTIKNMHLVWLKILESL